MKRVIGEAVGGRLLAVAAVVLLFSLWIAACDPPLHSISGQVSSSGSGLAGVTMTLDGQASATVTTDASGNYSFAALENGNYTITPSLTGYTFSPASSAQPVNGADIKAVNFSATSTSTFSISGTATSGGSGLAGVTVMLNGAASATVTTDAGGNYTFSGLAKGTYSVTPSQTGVTFTPPSSPQTISSADIPAVNFIGTPVSTFSVFGKVTSGSSGLSGVTITMVGAGSATTTTDATGVFILSGLVNGNYIIAPSQAGFTFSPPSGALTVSGANITGVNFATTSSQGQIVACPATGTTNVSIQDFLFTPSVLTVSAGGIVKWTNNGAVAHTVTSGTAPTSDGKFDSGNLAAGATACVQFSAAGSYPYFSATDSSMSGSITVQ